MAKVIKATQLDGVKASVMEGRLSIGRSKKFVDPKEALTNLSKGERRKIRKALHRQGFGGVAHSTI